MLIGVHKLTSDLRFVVDDYSINKTEVVIYGSRRERETKKGFWTESIKEVTEFLNKKYIDDQYELEAALAKLHSDHEKRVNYLHAQLKSHNNAFLD